MKTINRKSYQKSLPIFLLGFPRSGTNYLKSIIGTHPLVNTLNEPFSLSTKFFIKRMAYVWKEKDYNKNYYHKELRNSKEAFRLVETLKNLFQTNKEDIYLVKETVFLLKLRWLKKYLKNTRIILLIRNPLRIVSSFKRNNLFKKWNYASKIEILFKQKNENLKSYKLLFEKVNKQSEVSKLTLFWIISNFEALKNLSLFENIIVRYEDLINDPKSKLKEIMEFIGLNLEKKQIDFIEESRKKNLGKTIYSIFCEKKEEKITDLSFREIREISSLLKCGKEIAKKLRINFDKYFSYDNINIVSSQKVRRFVKNRSRKKFTLKECLLSKEKVMENIKNNSIEVKKGIYISLPITNAQFCYFLNSQKIKNSIDQINKYINTLGERCRIKYKNYWKVEVGYEDHPCTYINWFGASSFCNWLGVKLPTKKLILGILKKIKFSQLPKSINMGERIGDTTPVTYFKNISKRKLIFFIIGNVWKWTQAPKESLISYKYGGGFNSPLQQWNSIKKRPKLLGGSNLGFQVLLLIQWFKFKTP